MAEYDALDSAIETAMDLVASLRGGVVAYDDEGEPQYVPNPVLTQDTRTRAVQWTPDEDLTPPNPVDAHGVPPETKAVGIALIAMVCAVSGFALGAWLF